MAVSEKYLTLIKSFPLRPIRSDSELAKARAALHDLLDAAALTNAEEDYLDVLGNLIETYEQESHPILDLPPNVMLSEAMKAKGVTQTALAKATGIPVSTISELLSQKREFKVAHITKLCSYFCLGPSAFICVPMPEPAAR